MLNTDGPDESYDKFITLYMEAYNLAFPLKDNTIPQKYRKQSLWVTQGLVISSITKSKFLLIKHKYPTNENIQKYNNYCRLYRRLRRLSQAQFYDEQVKQSKHDMKKTWSF